MRVRVNILKADGTEWMVGKVIPTVEGTDIFYQEDKGTHTHVQLNSPGGIDVAVLDWLDGLGVTEVHHYNKRTRKLYMTTTETIRQNGIKSTQAGLTRYFLPYPFWKMSGKLNYVIPWCADRITLQHRPAPPELTHQEPQPEPGPRQLTLDT